MTLRSRVTRQTDALKSWVLYYNTERPVGEFYKLLKAYYLNNGLYDELYDAMYAVGTHDQGMRPLRNPAYRAVEFYAAKLWPGSLPDALRIVTENEDISAPIQKIWAWSNWDVIKQRAARWAGIYGDVFFKIEKPDGKDRVYFHLIEPQYVTDFTTDERGFMTWVRLDIPQVQRQADKTRLITHVEIYDKGSGTLRIWERPRGAESESGQLGDPLATYNLQDRLRNDFIPIVQAKLRDIGEDRGLGCFAQSIDKIDEANRMATRLHQMLWRYGSPIWALRANQVSPDGRPIPAPKIDKNSDDEVLLGGDKIMRLPGNSQLDPLIPNISWSDSLAILQDHMTELEHDLPELAYWRMREIGELSGKAVQLLLGDAIDKLLEARGNMESALVRANQMALSIGKAFDLEGFEGVGEYENGDLDHAFEAREVIPTPEVERAQTVLGYTSSKVAKESSLRKAGWSDQEIAQEKTLAEGERAQEQKEFAENMLQSARNLGQQTEARDAQPAA